MRFLSLLMDSGMDWSVPYFVAETASVKARLQVSYYVTRRTHTYLCSGAVVPCIVGRWSKLVNAFVF